MNADDRTKLIQIITEAIQRHARGDLGALAENIVSEVEDHGYEIGTSTRATPRLVETA